jgi:hypothetical protein
MNRLFSSAIAVAACALLVAPGDAFADCGVPPNMREGQQLVIYLPSPGLGAMRVRVDRVDRGSCWAKVSRLGAGGETWVNIRQVDAVSSGPELH